VQQKKAVSGRTMSFGYLLSRQNSILAKKEHAAGTVKKRLPHPPTLKRTSTGASYAASSRSGSEAEEHSAQNSSDDSESSAEVHNMQRQRADRSTGCDPRTPSLCLTLHLSRVCVPHFSFFLPFL